MVRKVWCIKTPPPKNIYIYIYVSGALRDYPKNGCEGDYTPLNSKYFEPPNSSQTKFYVKIIPFPFLPTLDIAFMSKHRHV